MAFLTESQVRKSAAATSIVKADSILLESAASTEFDVFLSHSSSEPKEIVDGIRNILRHHNISVYVDYHDDPKIAPSKVNKSTAIKLRNRLRHSKSLLYIHSDHSLASRWMPWEMGYMDGMAGKVGIVPVVKAGTDTFTGLEYLSLYPYVDQVRDTKGFDQLWINETPKEYALLTRWARGTEQIKVHSG